MTSVVGFATTSIVGFAMTSAVACATTSVVGFATTSVVGSATTSVVATATISSPGGSQEAVTIGARIPITQRQILLSSILPDPSNDLLESISRIPTSMISSPAP